MKLRLPGYCVTQKKEDLIKLGEECLPLILERDGEIIYSSHNTLKKGDIYLLGLNPGGEGFTTIKNHLSNILKKETNSYLDESWENKITTWPIGQAPLQKRVDFLLRSMGYKTKEVCSSNLIFVTSRNSDEINYGLAGYCWRFHQYILNIIQPKLILCFGVSSVSSYSFLHDLYSGKETTIDSGHGNWKCKAFTTIVEGKRTTVVGIPHLSYYNIVGKTEVIQWIKGFLK